MVVLCSQKSAGGAAFTDPPRARAEPCWMLCIHTAMSLWCGESGGVSAPAAQLCLSPTIPNPLWATQAAGIFLLCARQPFWTRGVEKSEQLNAEERREFGIGREEWGKRIQSLGRHNRAGHRIRLLAMQKVRGDKSRRTPALRSSTPGWLQQVRNTSKERCSCGANSTCRERAEEGLGQPPTPFPGVEEGMGGAGGSLAGQTDVPWCR